MVRLNIESVIGRSAIRQIQEAQKRLIDMGSLRVFDVPTVLGDLGATASFTEQMAAISEQARDALSFDAAAILRDASVASALTAQIEDIQKQAASAFAFDINSILEGLDLERLADAFAARDVAFLESSLPDGMQIDDEVVSAVAGAVLVAVLLRYLGSAIAQVAAAAAEGGLATRRLLLQAVDAAHSASPELRGLVILLSVVAAVKTLRAND